MGLRYGPARVDAEAPPLEGHEVRSMPSPRHSRRQAVREVGCAGLASQKPKIPQAGRVLFPEVIFDRPRASPCWRGLAAAALLKSSKRRETMSGAAPLNLPRPNCFERFEGALTTWSLASVTGPVNIRHIGDQTRRVRTGHVTPAGRREAGGRS